MTNNIAHPAFNDADMINNDIAKARKSFSLSKDEAGRAAAHTYIVWRRALAPTANADTRKWIEQEISDANQRIAEAAKAAGEKHGYVQIKAKAGASEFTRAVKFVLEFDRADQSSSVSRYCAALAWLHTRFADKVVNDTEEMMEAIKSAGGFEAILKKTPVPNTDTKEDEATTEEVRTKIAQFLLNRSIAQLGSKQAITTLTIPADADADDSWVLLVGRKSERGLDVLERFPATVENVCTLLGDKLLNVYSPTDPTAAFASRLLALGSLVESGQPSSVTRNGNPHGEKLKTERILTMRNGANETTELVFTTLYAKASTVITATPYATALQAPRIAPLYLPAANVSEAVKQLAGDARRVVKITADPNAAVNSNDSGDYTPLAWIMTNEALAANDGENATHVMRWSPISALDHMPLDVELRDFHTKATLDISHVSTTCAQLLSEYEKAKADATPLSIVVCDGTMSLQADKKGPVPFAEATGKLSVTLRGKDFHNLLKILREHGVSAVTLALDTAGLARISWTEPCGAFAVHIPTADADNKLNDRRFVPMVAAPHSSIADAA